MTNNECVIMFRNPSNGALGYITDDPELDNLCVFPNRDAAIKFAQEHFLLQAWPYQIVELDEI